MHNHFRIPTCFVGAAWGFVPGLHTGCCVCATTCTALCTLCFWLLDQSCQQMGLDSSRKVCYRAMNKPSWNDSGSLSVLDHSRKSGKRAPKFWICLKVWRSAWRSCPWCIETCHMIQSKHRGEYANQFGEGELRAKILTEEQCVKEVSEDGKIITSSPVAVRSSESWMLPWETKPWSLAACRFARMHLVGITAWKWKATR